MSRFYSYIRTAQQMLIDYDGSLPFAHFAKQFFAKEKKYGSTDRRQISALCYNYFRAAKALKNISEEEKMLAATFLCEAKPSKLLEQLKPEWNEAIELPIAEKEKLLPTGLDQEQLFPLYQHLSNEINHNAFRNSFLKQPDLFLRIRPGYDKVVATKLTEKGFVFNQLNEHCLALPNGSKIDDIIFLNKEAVVQDYSSQQTGEVLMQNALNQLWQINSWDCCAASGGKSIMLHDLRTDAKLTVSDIRSSILHNLQQRFKDAGIKHYRSFEADVSAPAFQLPHNQSFNLVIADVPCTGSGTWARTPEQCYFFKEEQIAIYANRQRQIVQNVLPYLQTGGFLAYITCSVFYEENEAVVKRLIEKNKLKKITAQYQKGYDMKADTLFIAILQKQ